MNSCSQENKDMGEILSSLPRATEGHWNKSMHAIVNDVKSIVNPTSMMEIGFNNGFSAVMWLHTCRLIRFDSIDIGLHHYVKPAVKILSEHYPDIFAFTQLDSMMLECFEWPIYDLVFVDGCHKLPYVLNDLDFAKKHGRYVLLDDTGGYSPGVTKALKQFDMTGLVEVKRWNLKSGCILYRNDSLDYKKWALHMIYHIKLIPELNNKVDRSKLKLIKCSGYKDNHADMVTEYRDKHSYEVFVEKEFPIYDPQLQKDKYHAPSAIYHFYKNNYHLGLDAVGFCEYDHILSIDHNRFPVQGKMDVMKHIDKIVQTQDRFVIPLSVRWTYKKLLDDKIMVKNDSGQVVNSMIEGIQLFNKFFNTRFEQIDPYTYIPTQQSFVADIETFKLLGSYISYLIDEVTLIVPKKSRPSTILERYIGIAMLLLNVPMKCVPLQHMGVCSRLQIWDHMPTIKILKNE